MDDVLYQQYGAAIRSVMDVRARYQDVCLAHGSESGEADQAHAYLEREVEHLNQVRDRYDAASGTPGK